MTTTPTFVKNGILLIGREAVEAFTIQTARCNCGCGSDGDRVGGTCGDMPAEWLVCGGNCSGRAIGFPLVYRTQSQVNFKRQELAANTPEAKKAAEEAREKAARLHLADLERGWDGFRFIGVEAGKKQAESLRR